MDFPIAVALGNQTDLREIERAMQHNLDTVVVPVDQGNWRRIRDLMTAVHENGWNVAFVLWAKGKQVKSVPLQKLANHPCLAGWLVQDISDPVLIAMLKATTQEGIAWSWQKPVPFTTGVLSLQPTSPHWWGWVTVDEPEALADKVFRSLLSGADGICFSCLPNESDLKGRERLKAIGFFATHLRLWKPLLAKRPSFSEAWEWRTDEAFGWVWNLNEDEFVCLFVLPSPVSQLTLTLPLVVSEGVRAYSVQFPAMVRLPLQRKGSNTIIKLNEPQTVNSVWLTKDISRVQRMHHHATTLLPKAMQFAVQWVLARKERLTNWNQIAGDRDNKVWSMLQEAKRRQFSQGYQIACQILKATKALTISLSDHQTMRTASLPRSETSCI